MKFLTIIILLLPLFNVNEISVLHGDETPHGGRVIHATNGYNIEKVRGINRLFFYLLESDERTTIKNKELQGVVELILKDGSKEKHALVLANDDEALKIVFTEKKKIKMATVHIRYKKKIITAKFN